MSEKNPVLVSYTEFIKKIADDFGLSIEKEYKLMFPAEPMAVKRFARHVAIDVRVWDGKTERPYMLAGQRNEEALKNATELRRIGAKGLDEIIKEARIELKSENCRLCEGGGWHSAGTRYVYKNYCIEI